jgi:hypothetical protein
LHRRKLGLDVSLKTSDECQDKRKEHVMTEKDYTLYGTKIFNSVTQEIGLLICIWKNKFADAEIDYATCVDKVGKRYNIELDNIEVLDDCQK